METHEKIAQHKVVSQEEWLKARAALLKIEKDLTHQMDKVAQMRQDLPWVKIEKDYTFDTDTGKASLKDLFCGRSQLIIYHFMFGPDYSAGCPSCSNIADSFNGIAVHLENHDVMFGVVSRAPLAKLQAYKKRMGWSFPWASSFGSDFNYDFHVSFTPEQQNDNIKSKGNAVKAEDKVSEAGQRIAASTGTDWATYTQEAPGMSCFVLRDGEVYHTYSAYERGLDGLWNMYQWLDRAPLGRNEEGNTIWFKRHDEYGTGNDSKTSCCN